MLPLFATETACVVCFYGPDNIAFDRSGKLYVTDSNGKDNGRVLVFTPSGTLLTQWHVFAAAQGGRYGPEGIALDRLGNVLVTDAARGSVIELTPQGRFTGTLGQPGAFPNLGHVAVDAHGNIYVAQARPNLIEKFGSDGSPLERWHRESGSEPNQWGGPESIAVLDGDDVVVEDWPNRRTETLSPHGDTLAIFGARGTASGQFTNTSGIAVDAQNNIYVADMGAHCVQKFDSRGGWISSICNSPGHELFKEGPGSVAVAADGTLYSADGLSLIKYTQRAELLARWR